MASSTSKVEKMNKKSELTDFYIEDFKDTSEKLESTDKKCQFTIQIYGALTTTLFTLISILWQTSGQDPQIQSFEFMGVVFLLIVVGEFVYQYIIMGNILHAMYLSRMNKLRCLILESLDVDKEAIRTYSFTGFVSSSSRGMGYTMKELLKWLIFLLSIPIIVVIFINHLCGAGLYYNIIVSAVILYLSIGLLAYNDHFFRKNCKKSDDNNKKKFGLEQEAQQKVDNT